jgi:hypothetical protein
VKWKGSLVEKGMDETWRSGPAKRTRKRDRLERHMQEKEAR